MKTIVALLLLALASTTALGCDRAAARQTQLVLAEMAVWKEKDDVVTVKWGPDWDSYSKDQKLAMITAFADADACLNYDARKIHFYRYSKLVGRASPTGGIYLVD